jgi:hypothetical protein
MGTQNGDYVEGKRKKDDNKARKREKKEELRV